VAAAGILPMFVATPLFGRDEPPPSTRATEREPALMVSDFVVDVGPTGTTAAASGPAYGYDDVALGRRHRGGAERLRLSLGPDGQGGPGNHAAGPRQPPTGGSATR
jgi:hypothetical protein